MNDPMTMTLTLLIVAYIGWVLGAWWAERRLMRQLDDICRRPGPVTRDIRPPTPHEREMLWRSAYGAVPVEHQLTASPNSPTPDVDPTASVDSPSARHAATAPDGGTHQPATDHGGYVNRAPAAGCRAGIPCPLSALTEEPTP